MSRHRLPSSGPAVVLLALTASVVSLLIVAVALMSSAITGPDIDVENPQAVQSVCSILLGQSESNAVPSPTEAGATSVMYWGFDYNDALTPPYRLLSSFGLPQPAPSLGLYEQSLYMIGTVAVTVIFPESSGLGGDPNNETWDSTRINNCINEITAGLNWWEGQIPSGTLDFRISSYGQRSTVYEPITRPWQDESLWIAEIMNGLGYTSGSYLDQVAALNQYEINQQATDWAFTIFVVDSQNDFDGMFSNNWFAYGYTGGPFMVMTYDNNGYTINGMDYACAHEAGHIFWATDEYNSTLEYSGYLNVADNDSAACLMKSNALPWSVCSATSGQIGWSDTDTDSILEPVDTLPATGFAPSPLDYVNYSVLTYTGQAWDVPLNNSNPKWWSTGIDVSINTTADVEYRIDGGSWTDCTAADGAFDGRTENFTFTTPSLSAGTHLIETRAQNSVGNWQTAFTQHTVVIDTTNPAINMNGIPDYVNSLSSVTGSASDSTPGKLDRIRVLIRNVSQSTYWNGSTWVSSESWLTASGTASWSFVVPALTDGQTYEIRARALDEAGNQSSLVTDTFSFDTTGPVLAANDIPDFLASLSFVSGTVSDASPGQVVRVEVQFRQLSQNACWNGTAWVTDESWLTATGTASWNWALPSLKNGEAYEVRVRAFDEAGNQSSLAPEAFTVDTTSPVVALDNISDFVNSPPFVGGNASDTSPGEVSTVEVQIRNVSQSAYWNGIDWTSEETWLVATGTDSWNCPMPDLADGESYQIKARGSDKAGNGSPEVVEAFVNDASPPEMSGIPDIESRAGSVPDIGGTASDAAPGSVDRVRILLHNRSDDTYWNGSSWVPEARWNEATGTDSWSYEMPRLKNGKKYELRVYAVDEAGNESTIHTDAFTFDSRLPFWIWIVVGLATALVVMALVIVVLRARARRNSLDWEPQPDQSSDSADQTPGQLP